MPHLANIHAFARLETGSGLKADVIQVTALEAFIASGAGGQSENCNTKSVLKLSSSRRSRQQAMTQLSHFLFLRAAWLGCTSQTFCTAELVLRTTELLAEVMEEARPYLPPTWLSPLSTHAELVSTGPKRRLTEPWARRPWAPAPCDTEQAAIWEHILRVT